MIWSTRSVEQEKEGLRKVCAVLARDYKVTIELTDDKGAVPHVNAETGAIKLGVGDMAENGPDFYVGAILHEIAHIRHSPAKNPRTGYEGQVYNMLEDMRIEAIMSKEYAGGSWYLGELHEPALYALEVQEKRVTPSLGPTVKNAISNAVNVAIQSYREDISRAGEVIPDNEQKKRDTELEYTETQKIKKHLLYKTLGLAILEVELRRPVFSSTGVVELDDVVEKLADILHKAKSVKSVEALTARAIKLLEDILPEPEKEGQQAGHGLSELVQSGGHGASPAHGHERWHIYAGEDAKAKPQVEPLKRKLIAHMRENDRAKYHGNKRRGLLDKRALSRTARDNYRIYRKRELIKKKKYAVSVVVDASGSMFDYGMKQENNRINHALRAAAILVRTFRAMKFPTSMTVYGTEPKTVLGFGDLYIPQVLEDRMENLDSAYYHSGDNQTHKAIKEAMPRLLRAGVGRHKIMVIITDGGLDGPDVRESRKLLEKQKADFSPLLFYVESNTQRILDDESKERTIQNAGELPGACIELMKELVLV